MRVQGEPPSTPAQARRRPSLRTGHKRSIRPLFGLMGVETERKFLLNGDGWRAAVFDSRTLRQGYLAIDKGSTVRVRTDGKQGWLTIKGRAEGLSRPEFEYAVPAGDARELLAMCHGRLVEKVRHRVRVGSHVWEVDEFDGANRGLVVAELELASPEEEFVRPEWLGHEVSDDPRYLNANLSIRPYGQWAEKADASASS